MSVTMLNFLCVHVCHAAAYFSLLEGRFRVSVMAFLWTAYVVVAWSASTAIFLFAPVAAKWGIFALTVALHIALYGWTAQGSAWKKCFFVATYLTFFFFSVLLNFWLVIPFLGQKFLVYEAARIPLYALIIALWTIKGRAMVERSTAGITDGWRILALFSLLMCAGVSVLTLFVFPAEFTANRLTSEAVRTTLCTLVIVVAAYIMLFRTISLLSHEMESEQLRLAQNLLKSELESEKQYISQAKRYRHDIRHHIQLLLALFDSGEFSKIRSYLSECDSSLDNSALPSFCRHIVANALLGNAKRKFDGANIPCDLDCNIPESLPLSDVEVCVVFGNLLENAFEACEKCRVPFFSLVATQKSGIVCIECRNSVSGEVRFKDDRPVTTKPSGGTGTRSMLETIEKHGGVVRFEQNGSEFVVKIILPLENLAIHTK